MTPEISIIVLNFNGFNHTKTCLEHIWENTSGHRYEIVVVDNGSSLDEYLKLSTVAGPFNLVRLSVNRYFGEGNNIAVELCRGQYLVFLNNDSFVSPAWLPPLIGVLQNEPNAGGVGPMLLYPNGDVQEAGAYVDENAHPLRVGKPDLYEPDELFRTRIVDYCSAACFVTTRELFEAVGGFDLLYQPAYYEDVDLCLKISSLSKFIYYCPDARVTHIEHGTASRYMEPTALRSILETSRSTLLSRWGGWLGDRAANRDSVLPNCIPPAPEQRRDFRRAKVVFYTPDDLIPGGGQRYMLAAAAALSEHHDVWIATDEIYSHYRLRGLAHELAIDVSNIALVRRSDLHTLGEIAHSIVLSNGTLPPIPGFGLWNTCICQVPFPVPGQRAAARQKNLDTFDEVLVYSRFVRDCLRGALDELGYQSKKIQIISPSAVSSSFSTTRGDLAHSHKILFTGRFFVGADAKRHDVAIQGVRELVRRGINAELHLVGTLHTLPEDRAYYDELRRAAAGLPVYFHANAPRQKLEQLLRECAIYWHATGFGIDAAREPEKCECFGIAILEAMSAGCVPLVFGNGGPLEFVVDGETGYFYGSVEDLVEKTIFLLNDPACWKCVAVAASIAAEKFSDAAFSKNWIEYINRADQDIRAKTKQMAGDPLPRNRAAGGGDAAKRQAVVVLGMHRSGTSAMAGVFGLAGATMPADLMPPHSTVNLTGFWEPQQVADLNDAIFSSMDSSWHDLFIMRDMFPTAPIHPSVAALASEIIKADYGDADLILIKDPRLSILAPFWRQALEHLGYHVSFVIMVRPFLEVIESIERRDGFSRPKASLLYSSYMLQAEKNTRGHDRLFVSYDDLLGDWRALLKRISSHFNIAFELSPATDATIDAFLNSSLRHHHGESADKIRAASWFDPEPLARWFEAAANGAETPREALDHYALNIRRELGATGSVTADDVKNCYRWFLGRPPESVAVVEAMAALHPRSLLILFVTSPEFRNEVYDKVIAGVGRHDLFNEPDLLSWGAAFFPLDQGSRDRMRQARGWHDAYAILFSDPRFLLTAVDADRGLLIAPFIEALNTAAHRLPQTSAVHR